MLRLTRMLFRRLFAHILGRKAVHNLPPARPRPRVLGAGELEDRLYPGSVAEVFVAAALGGVASEPLVAVAGALGDQAFVGPVGEPGVDFIALSPPPVGAEADPTSVAVFAPEPAAETSAGAPEFVLASDPPTPTDPFDDLLPDGVGIVPYGGVAVDPATPVGGNGGDEFAASGFAPVALDPSGGTAAAPGEEGELGWPTGPALLLSGSDPCHPIAGGDLAEDWTDTSRLAADDNWSGVANFIAYRGDNLTTGIGVDPQTILADGAGTPVDVTVNRTDPSVFNTGGVAEFEGANPTVALNGSGTADAPYLVAYVNTTGVPDVRVSYTLRDLDGSVDNAVSPVAFQYRVGAGGLWVNVPAAFVPDATDGGAAGRTTAVSVVLPPSAGNQSQVQVRWVTTNAVGNDEWVGVDDIRIGAAAPPNIGPSVTVPTGLTTPAGLDLAVVGVGVTDPDAGAAQVRVTVGVGHGTLTYASTAGLTVDPAGPNGSATVTVTGSLADLNAALGGLVYRADVAYTGTEVLTVTADDLGNTGAGGPRTATGTTTIAVTPALPTVSVAGSGDASEDGGSGGFALTRDAIALAAPLSVWVDLGGTAKAADYTVTGAVWDPARAKYRVDFAAGASVPIGSEILLV